MNNGNFAEGVAIIAKYLKPDGYDLAAEHDELYFGSDEGMSEADKARLFELGWSQYDSSGDSWHCFT